jgi:branched-chain amino acid transport system ATP-binding protein
MGNTDKISNTIKNKHTVNPLLSVRNVTKKFDAVVALDDLSFEVEQHEILGIAGPNGAGKSTLLNVCSGMLAPNKGKIIFNNERVEGLPPYQMCLKGVGRTFQIPQVFGSLSVEENVSIGYTFGASGKPHLETISPELTESILDLTGLSSQRDQQVGTVNLLTRKMIMLAAVLATQPLLVFMDEPLAGLNSEEIEIFASLITHLHSKLDITFVVVEHKIRALSSLSDRLMIIHFGGLLCLDTPDVVVKDDRVIDVYLGMEYDA